jgi:hypothetical protein
MADSQQLAKGHRTGFAAIAGRVCAQTLPD